MKTKANDGDTRKTTSRLAWDSSHVAFAKTGESDESDSTDRPASIWRRVIANCIDIGIYSIGTVFWYLFYLTRVLDHQIFVGPPLSEISQGMISLSGWLLLSLLGESLMLACHGRTVGKCIARISVKCIEQDRTYLPLWRAFVRTFIKSLLYYGLCIGLPLLISYIINIRYDHVIWAKNTWWYPWYSVWNHFVWVLNLGVIIVFIGVFRKDRRGPHDLIAGSRAVNV